MIRKVLLLTFNVLWPFRYPRTKVWVAIAAGAVTVYVLYYTPEKRAVRAHLGQADTHAKAAIGPRLQPVRALFAKARKGAPAFAEEALSWRGKVAAVRGFFGSNAQREFMADAFARHIFSPAEMRSAIEGACRGYADDLDGVEAQMLVRIRADLDLAGRPAEGIPAHLRNDEAFAREYRVMAGKVAAKVGVDVAVLAGREIVVLAASEVATRAAIQVARAAATELGIQTAVLSGGGVSMVVTLGAGLVIAVIIEYVIDEVFRLVGYDPKANVAAAVVASLDRMEAALIRDTSGQWFFDRTKPGALRAEMERLSESRSRLRREAVALTLKEGGIR
ncbi:MAG TPA: hypothetical protein VD866_17625 [Urbifossiella sp.]|nr:hypothetical protein [Urbifossiella sp.]